MILKPKVATLEELENNNHTVANVKLAALNYNGDEYLLIDDAYDEFQPEKFKIDPNFLYSHTVSKVDLNRKDPYAVFKDNLFYCIQTIYANSEEPIYLDKIRIMFNNEYVKRFSIPLLECKDFATKRFNDYQCIN